MKIVLATGNKSKLAEFKKMCTNDLIAFSDILGDLEIVEDGDTFAKNAMIKAKTIYDKLPDDDDYIVISDDSGLSVPMLNNEPNIYSARYAGENASDKENLEKLIFNLKENDIKSTEAYYTAAIAVVSRDVEYVVHGWMYGNVIDTVMGSNGFGYDSIFIPNGFDKTLGQLKDEIKSKISHRKQALLLAKPIIEMLLRRATY